MKKLLLLPFIYFTIAAITFQFRNPTANDAALWLNLPSVLTFQKLEKFQGNQ